ncbi:MAG: pimeloyl-ACP methyl ester esterase BioH [Thiotrichales bacterium]|nr:MAG: pimeloyl-ACP methyl ester esterase BioH [Thiotrichales bacterium]
MKIDLILIHGWAMNSAVWQPCVQRLPDGVTSQCIDLPGYGKSLEVNAGGLDDYVEQVAQQISGPAVLVGWSLGGLVSLRLAQRFPEKVSALVQVASSPKFVQAIDWPTAIEPGVFEQFAASLQKDVMKTIRRFLALQVRSTDTSATTVRALQHTIDQRGLPTNEALLTGLKILSETDLRQTLRSLHCPVTWILGEKDMLVPVTLAGALDDMLSAPDVHIVQGAGHAPFISHPEAFVAELLRAAGRS